jgi:glycosyltransferase involved in cell wall biosynthesis
MNLFIANDSKMSLGGGWSFIGNLVSELKKDNRVTLVDNIDDCETVLLPSSSMVTPDTVKYAKEKGKKIYLRVDNMPRNSRNRNCGSSRLRDFAETADGIIFQSNWAYEYLGWWLEHSGVKVGNKSTVILNGVDTDVFNDTGAKHDPNIYLYSRYNRDETKNWHEAWYTFLKTWRKNQKAELWITGQFSKELVEYNFDFFQGEKVEYKGVITDPQYMAEIYRTVGTVLAPYYNDACSNTIIEAKACGCEIIASYTGGTPEIIDLEDLSASRMAGEYIKFMKGEASW